VAITFPPPNFFLGEIGVTTGGKSKFGAAPSPDMASAGIVEFVSGGGGMLSAGNGGISATTVGSAAG